MKLKLKRHKGEWISFICKGNGGGTVHSRMGSFIHCLKGFNIKNLRKAWQ